MAFAVCCQNFLARVINTRDDPQKMREIDEVVNNLEAEIGRQTTGCLTKRP
jgi:hypothetical protein